MNGSDAIEYEEAEERKRAGGRRTWRDKVDLTQPEEETETTRKPEHNSFSFDPWINCSLDTPAERRAMTDPGQNERDVQRIRRQQWEFKKAFKK